MLTEKKKLYFKVSRNELPSNDNGYSPDDTEGGIQLSTPGTKELYPCFKTCLMCKANNTNPYFQYCHKCFRVSNYRVDKDFFYLKKNIYFVVLFMLSIFYFIF